MNLDRICHIKTVMAAVAPETVGLNEYLIHDESCGTIACVAGWCCLDPKFNEEGLIWREYNNSPGFQRFSPGFHSLMGFFDIGFHEAENLFGARWGSEYDHEIEHLTPTDHERAMHRIKRFLEDHDPQPA
ncbi:hypothetical protein [Cupriavidus sp. RAF12]|uniref:hypothetical protein n=1 Tax=Cupriavidus sp. RAF12 TaxID=3233050 RepID=UPI003F8DC8E7